MTGASGLAADLTVTRDGERWRATIPSSWSFLAPNGGYLGALCMRAVSAALPERVPASISCTFLRAARPRLPAYLALEAIRTTKRVDAVVVSLLQEDEVVLRATVWTRRPSDPAGFVHEVRDMPPYPPPAEVPVMPNEGPRKTYAFYRNLEERRLPPPAAHTAASEGGGGAEGRPEAPPEWRAWYRFVPASRFGDPTLDSARSLILLDALAIASCTSGHPTKMCMATTTQTDVLFCGASEAQDSDWLLLDMRCPVSQGGMMWATGAVWSERGQLLALGQSNMLFLGEVVDR